MANRDVSLVETLPRLPARARDAHKGTFGTVLVVAGSRGMSGAAVLCARGALRGGAGLVRAAVPASVLDVVAAAEPCAMTVPLRETADGNLHPLAPGQLVPLAEKSDAVVVGPGLGATGGVAVVVRGLLARTHTPLVLDADALNVLGTEPEGLKGRRGPVVLTPHPGEFARMCGCDTKAVQADREGKAVDFAARYGVIVVLKGAGTVVTDGRRLYVNPTGNPGMATGGSGDVLAGLTGALLGQGLPAFEAAQLAAFVHGRAGDLAADDLGETSLIASDLIAYLPRAFRALTTHG